MFVIFQLPCHKNTLLCSESNVQYIVINYYKMQLCLFIYNL
jgi:hypothetical protein